MKKQEMSLKQQYQRLTMAKAQATRNGQPTPKLDKKIEKMKAMMGSTVQKVPAAKPSLPSSTSCPCRVVPALRNKICHKLFIARKEQDYRIKMRINVGGAMHAKNIQSPMFNDGQIHIAKWVRNALDLNDGDELLFEVVDNKIIFTKAEG